MTIKRLHRGFTLVELLVVIAIIAVLATLGIRGGSGAITKAKKLETKLQLSGLTTAMNGYYADYGTYPNVQDITVLNEDPNDEGAELDGIGESRLLVKALTGEEGRGSSDLDAAGGLSVSQMKIGTLGQKSASQSRAATKLNPRNTQYLSAESAIPSGTSPVGFKKGVDYGEDGDGSYAFVDTWGNPLAVFWDKNYDNRVRDPFGGEKDYIKQGVIAISKGNYDSEAMEDWPIDPREIATKVVLSYK